MEYHGHILRHEYKYIINYYEYSYLKPLLQAIMEPDAYSGPEGYHLRSLYFDDMYSSALSEKESGVCFRQKYRIRIYNKSDTVIKLERKDKYNDYISKTSVPLTKDQFYRIIHNDNIGFLLESDNALMHDMFAAIRTMRLSPAVTVDYHRDVLVCRDGNVRITFDKDLEAGIDTPDIFDPSMTTVRALEPNLMVLEIKYDDYLPDTIKKALQITSHRREAVSKYVYCRLAQMKYNPSATVLFRHNGGF